MSTVHGINKFPTKSLGRVLLGETYIDIAHRLSMKICTLDVYKLHLQYIATGAASGHGKAEKEFLSLKRWRGGDQAKPLIRFGRFGN